MGCGASKMREVDIPEVTATARPASSAFVRARPFITSLSAAAASLEEILGPMENASHNITVVCNTSPLAVPYTGAPAHENADVEWGVEGKRHRALYCGITCVAKLAGQEFLVSDSFRPCVPIVVFNNDATWLVHANGSSVHHFRIAKGEMIGGQVVIICKTLHAQQREVATDIGFQLVAEGFNVQIADVATDESIAVIVGGRNKRIIVYSS